MIYEHISLLKSYVVIIKEDAPSLSSQLTLLVQQMACSEPGRGRDGSGPKLGMVTTLVVPAMTAPTLW